MVYWLVVSKVASNGLDQEFGDEFGGDFDEFEFGGAFVVCVC